MQGRTRQSLGAAALAGALFGANAFGQAAPEPPVIEADGAATWRLQFEPMAWAPALNGNLNLTGGDLFDIDLISLSEVAWAPAWQAAFAEWLSATPLTDIANAGRSAPAFRWTGATLALIESPMGRNLARRALSRVADRQRAFQALAQATAHIGGTPAEELANAFLAELQITSAGQ